MTTKRNLTQQHAEDFIPENPLLHDGTPTPPIDSNFMKIGVWNVGGLAKNHLEIFDACKNQHVTCLIETFEEEGDEAFLRIPDGFTFVPSPGKRLHPTGRAAGGFGILVNNSFGDARKSDFQCESPAIFHGPVKLKNGDLLHLVIVYRAAWRGSPVYDEDFFDNQHYLN